MGPANVWEAIRFLVQPVSLHILHESEKTVIKSSSLTRFILDAVWRRRDAEQRATGVSALPLMSPRVGEFSPVSPSMGGMEMSPPALSTLCVVSPLNRLCPERRYILRSMGKRG